MSHDVVGYFSYQRLAVLRTLELYYYSEAAGKFKVTQPTTVCFCLQEIAEDAPGMPFTLQLIFEFQSNARRQHSG